MKVEALIARGYRRVRIGTFGLANSGHAGSGSLRWSNAGVIVGATVVDISLIVIAVH